MKALFTKILRKRSSKASSRQPQLYFNPSELNLGKKEDQQPHPLTNSINMSDEQQESEIVDNLIKMGDHLKITKINRSLQGEYLTLCHINHILCSEDIRVQDIHKFLLSKSSERVEYKQEELLQKNPSLNRNAVQYYTLYSNGLIFQFYSVRALLWKISLDYLPSSKNKWVSIMEGTLIHYHNCIRQHILDIVSKRNRKKSFPPDNSDKCQCSQVENEKKKQVTDHPLNSLKESKWKTFFEDKDLWIIIEKDTMRTKPNCKFFREEFQIEMDDTCKFGVERWQVHLSKDRQKTYYYDCLTRIIYIFLKINPDFQYCQGMNEIAALIFYSFANKNSQYFRRVAESDAYFCFQKAIKALYKLPIPGLLNGEKYSHRFEELLKRVDLRLYQELQAKPGTLNSLRILSIKWFNSLFLNEYEIDQSLILWDGFVTTICTEEQNFISFSNLLMSVALALIHLNRTALSEGQNPLLIYSKLPHRPQTLLQKALSLYKIFRQFFQ